MPSIYLVVEWVTIWHPNSKSLQLIGVANVLLIIKGTPLSWTNFAIGSISNIFNEEFAIDSPNTHFELGLNVLFITSLESRGFINAAEIDHTKRIEYYNNLKNIIETQ